MPLRIEFYEAVFPPLEEVNDPLRTSARALKYSNDAAKRPVKKSPPPLTYARPNKPTQGEVSAS